MQTLRFTEAFKHAIQEKKDHHYPFDKTFWIDAVVVSAIVLGTFGVVGVLFGLLTDLHYLFFAMTSWIVLLIIVMTYRQELRLQQTFQLQYSIRAILAMRLVAVLTIWFTVNGVLFFFVFYKISSLIVYVSIVFLGFGFAIALRRMQRLIYQFQWEDRPNYIQFTLATYGLAVGLWFYVIPIASPGLMYTTAVLFGAVVVLVKGVINRFYHQNTTYNSSLWVGLILLFVISIVMDIVSFWNPAATIQPFLRLRPNTGDIMVSDTAINHYDSKSESIWIVNDNRNGDAVYDTEWNLIHQTEGEQCVLLDSNALCFTTSTVELDYRYDLYQVHLDGSIHYLGWTTSSPQYKQFFTYENRLLSFDIGYDNDDWNYYILQYNYGLYGDDPTRLVITDFRPSSDDVTILVQTEDFVIYYDGSDYRRIAEDTEDEWYSNGVVVTRSNELGMYEMRSLVSYLEGTYDPEMILFENYDKIDMFQTLEDGFLLSMVADNGRVYVARYDTEMNETSRFEMYPDDYEALSGVQQQSYRLLSDEYSEYAVYLRNDHVMVYNTRTRSLQLVPLDELMKPEVAVGRRLLSLRSAMMLLTIGVGYVGKQRFYDGELIV